ncbi:MAG: hypothetical protein KF881_01425 [Acidobacteria bacterium]|nr:hypothetical protein [Acidobacteriota bacterium]
MAQNILMKADGLSRRRIEEAARKILFDFSPNAVTSLKMLDIEKMFEQYLPNRFGIETCYEEMSHGIHGYTDPTELRCAVAISLIDSKDLPTVRFGRSTIGHEIGHAILHAHQFRRKKAASAFMHDDEHASQYLFRKSEIAVYENPEWQAWEFCKSLFVPRIAVEKAIADGCSIRDLSEITNLNPAFIESRLRGLKMLDRVRAF